MATLIPALNSCKPRMTSGERRLAERLEEKLGACGAQIRRVSDGAGEDE